MPTGRQIRAVRRGAGRCLRRAGWAGLAFVVSVAIARPAARCEELLHFDWVPSWGPQILGGQATVIEQRVLPFHNPYQGQNSFKANGDDEISHSYGLYLGAQVTSSVQIYVDTEMIRGSGISNATGLGGYTNGEVIRQGSVDLGQAPYVARAFLRYVIPLGSEAQKVERDMDHLPRPEATERLEFRVGKLATTDTFDVNRYANSTRTQFTNWALFNNAAWDFAADTRGYTNGVEAAWVHSAWTLRVGSYQVVTFANGNVFDNDVLRARGDNVELTLRPSESGTVVRVLGYVNQARMGDYREAVARARATGQTPSIADDGRPGRLKYGFGLNLEQPLADGGDTGLFLRLGWNDGRTEDFMFTEVDRAVSGGVQISGTHWGRPEDRVGVAYAANFLSPEHRDYLAAGGSGFMLGDGRLNYAPEQILETYYRWQVFRYAQVGPDFQFIQNPGHNRDRGPAYVVGFRVHLFF
jgi:high affinity Mn2+ porin